MGQSSCTRTWVLKVLRRRPQLRIVVVSIFSENRPLVRVQNDCTTCDTPTFPWLVLRSIALAMSALSMTLLLLWARQWTGR